MLRAQADPEHPGAKEVRSMSLIGREAELNRLLEEVSTAVGTSSGRSVFLQGAPGVGKTALVSELIQRLRRERPDITVARGQCVQTFGSPDPYHPFVDALRDLSDEESLGFAQREAFSDLLAELAPYWLSIVPVVGGVLSAGFSTMAALRGKKPSAPPSEDALFVQYLQMITRLAERSPLVLLLEDLQWADRSSVALLGHLVRGVAGLPVVVVGTFRTMELDAERNPLQEVVPELERERLAERITVGELGPEALRALLASELGGRPSEPLWRWISERAGGNPLFVLELCRMLRQAGGVREDRGERVLAEAAQRLSAPRSAEAVVAARLQELDPESLRLLQYASVEGQEFSSVVLARLLEEEELGVLDRLAEVERRHQLIQAAGELTYPGGDVGSLFRFASPPVQGALYRGVVGKRRVLLHRKLGEILESLCEGAPEALAGKLARHFREGQLEQAAERYARMAETTRRVDTSRDAGVPRAAEASRGSVTSSADPLSPSSSAPHAAPRRGAFVGREAELDSLAREIAAAVEQSAGRSLFIEGPPGAGKTTLVRELLDRLGRERPDITVARGRCLQTFGSADPYLPFVNALCDLSDEASLGFTQKESFGELLAEIAPFWVSAVPVVGNLLSAALSTASVLRGKVRQGGAPSREALFIQYLELIQRLSERTPLLLFFDDLHWADQASVALLAHVSRGIARLPVVIVGTLRSDVFQPGRHPLADLIRELEGEELSRRVALDELRGEALDALLSAEFGGDLSEPLRRWIIDAAGGNPLFASELSRLLKQTGAAVERMGEWFLTDAVHTLGIPRSAEAVIETRIQRLDRTLIQVLQYASVEGNEFTSTVLSRLLDQDELHVLEAVEHAERHHQLLVSTGDLTLPTGETATTLQFRHALIQTVLYRQVTGKRRILLHRKAGEVLEELFRGSLESIAGKLARHFHEGKRSAPAYRYAWMAADRARHMYAYWESEEFFKIALEHSPGPREALQIEERLGDLYFRLGFYERGIDCYASALRRSPDQQRTVLRLRRRIIQLEYLIGNTPAPVLVERLRALLKEAADHPFEHCQLLFMLGRLPDSGDAMENARKAIDVAEMLHDPVLLAEALEQLAMQLMFTGGNTWEAIPLMERAFHLRGGTSDPLRAARYYNFVGVAYVKLGRYAEAHEALQQMLAFGERLGDPNRIAAACDNLGALFLRRGAFEEAEQLLERARLLHERRDRQRVVHSLDNLAEGARLRHDYPRAIERFQQLLERARELEYWTFEAVAHAGIGLCLLDMGHLEEARESLARASAVVDGREEWFQDRDVLEILQARIEASDGWEQAAEQRLQRASEALVAADTYLWARVELERARILRELNPAGAQALLERVYASCSGMESPPLEEQIASVRQLFFPAPVVREPVLT
jgi:predicted ATPase/Tfp pilus assembly protein PilF